MTIPLNFHVIGHRINTGMAGLANALSYLHRYRKLSLYGTFIQEGYTQRNFMVLRSSYEATFDYLQT